MRRSQEKKTRQEYTPPIVQKPHEAIFKDHEKKALWLVLQHKDRIIKKTPPHRQEIVRTALESEESLKEQLKKVHGPANYNSAIIYLGLVADLLNEKSINRSKKYGSFLVGALSLAIQGLTKEITARNLRVMHQGKPLATISIKGNTIHVEHANAGRISFKIPTHPGFGILVTDRGAVLHRFSPYYSTSKDEIVAHLMDGPERLFLVVPNIAKDGRRTQKFTLIIPTVKKVGKIEIRERKTIEKLPQRHSELIQSAYGIKMKTYNDLSKFFEQRYNKELAEILTNAAKVLLMELERAPRGARPDIILSRLFDGWAEVKPNRAGIDRPHIVPEDGQAIDIREYLKTQAHSNNPKKRIKPNKIIIPVGDRVVIVSKWRPRR